MAWINLPLPKIQEIKHLKKAGIIDWEKKKK